MIRWRSATNAGSFAAMTMLLIVWLGFLPVQFGGRTGYLIVNGISMEPLLHAGDLVITQQAERYEAKDIVVYQDPFLGTVIHRIISQANGHYTLRGDNNTWLDKFNPSPADIVGKLWIVVPAAGKVILLLREPLGVAIIVALISGMVLFQAAIKKQGSKRSGQKPSRGASIMFYRFGLSRDDALLILAAICAIALGLGITALSHPLTRSAADEMGYQHQGTFTYTSRDSQGIYDGGYIESGQPVFRKVTDVVTVTFVYMLTSNNLQNVKGSYRINAQVSDSTGWKRTTELTTTTQFKGSYFISEVPLNLAMLQKMIDDMEKPTGIHRTQYKITIAPQVLVLGTASGLPWQDTFAPHLNFQLDESILFLENYDDSKPIQDLLSQKQTGTIQGSKTEPNTLTLLMFTINVMTARIAAAIVFLFPAIGILILLMRPTSVNPATAIENRYAKLLVSVSRFPQAGTVTDVTTMDDLIKLAEKDNHMVLYVTDGGKRTYFVQDGSAVFRFILNLHEPGDGVKATVTL